MTMKMHTMYVDCWFLEIEKKVNLVCSAGGVPDVRRDRPGRPAGSQPAQV